MGGWNSRMRQPPRLLHQQQPGEQSPAVQRGAPLVHDLLRKLLIILARTAAAIGLVCMGQHLCDVLRHAAAQGRIATPRGTPLIKGGLGHQQQHVARVLQLPGSQPATQRGAGDGGRSAHLLQRSGQQQIPSASHGARHACTSGSSMAGASSREGNAKRECEPRCTLLLLLAGQPCAPSGRSSLSAILSASQAARTRLRLLGAAPMPCNGGDN